MLVSRTSAYSHTTAARSKKADQPAADRLLAKSQPDAKRTRSIAEVGGVRSIPPDSPRPRRSREVHPARRTALRQRRHSSRHGDEQDPQRLHREVAQHDGLRRALCARLRLPRPANRTARRTCADEEGQEEERPQYREFSSRVSRARAERAKESDTRFQTTRYSRRVGRSISHDVEPLRGRDGAHGGTLRRTWLRLQRRASGLLVHRGPNGARRSRGRVLPAHESIGLCEISLAQRSGADRSGARGTQSVCRNLEHHTVDAGGESGYAGLY